MRALEVLKSYAQSPAAPAALSTSGEDDNRLAFQSRDSDSAFMLNWPYVYPSVLEADPQLAKDYGYAPYPQVDADEPARPALGGYNLGIGRYTRDREAALAAMNCLTEPAQQRTIATTGGQPSVLRELSDDPEITEKLPVPADHGTPARERRASAGPRQLQRHLAGGAPGAAPADATSTTRGKTYAELRDLVDTALKSQAVL